MDVELRAHLDATQVSDQFCVVWLLRGSRLLVRSASVGVGVCRVHHVRDLVFLIIKLL